MKRAAESWRGGQRVPVPRPRRARGRRPLCGGRDRAALGKEAGVSRRSPKECGAGETGQGPALAGEEGSGRRARAAYARPSAAASGRPGGPLRGSAAEASRNRGGAAGRAERGRQVSTVPASPGRSSPHFLCRALLGSSPGAWSCSPPAVCPVAQPGRPRSAQGLPPLDVVPLAPGRELRRSR